MDELLTPAQFAYICCLSLWPSVDVIGSNLKEKSATYSCTFGAEDLIPHLH